MNTSRYNRMVKHMKEQMEKNSRARGIRDMTAAPDTQCSKEIIGFANPQLNAIIQSKNEVRRARETWLKGMD